MLKAEAVHIQAYMHPYWPKKQAEKSPATVPVKYETSRKMFKYYY